MRTILLLSLCAVIAGCRKTSPEASGESGLVSDLGGPVPHRIVSLSCAATDIFIALGQLDRVIAVEEDCPCPGTENKVKIRNEDHPGKLAALNVESVIALHPDRVIAQPDLRDAIRGRGVRIVWTVEHYTYKNIPDLVNKIGKLLHIEPQAQALLDHMHALDRKIREITKGLPKVTVYYETVGIGKTMGSVGVMNSMIELAGGLNIARRIHKSWAQITPEEIFAKDPDVIILGPWTCSVTEAISRPGWDKLKAVKNHRVYKIPPARRNVAQGTPRCVDECARMLAPWLHPEVAGKLKAAVAELAAKEGSGDPALQKCEARQLPESPKKTPER